MVILINGALGVGKTSVAWALLDLCGRGVMLDMDYLAAVHPFDHYNDAHLDAAEETLLTLVRHHAAAGIEHFIINWVFESAVRLCALRRRLATAASPVRTFLLTCPPEELERRIRTRHTPEVAQELTRARELTRILADAACTGDVGLEVDTAARTPAEVAAHIWADVRRPVRVVPHDPAWAEQGRMACAALARALGECATSIEHIGSTAVPGLDAKPTLDILITVRRFDRTLDCLLPLRGLGYAFIDHPDNRDRRFFRKGFPPTHHVHIVEAGHPEAAALCAFRDALRADPALRARYAALKSDLLRRFPNDTITFSQEKARFVRAALAAPPPGRLTMSHGAEQAMRCAGRPLRHTAQRACGGELNHGTHLRRHHANNWQYAAGPPQPRDHRYRRDDSRQAGGL